jgi:hypothetical protein
MGNEKYTSEFDARKRVWDVYPGAVEMPDQSGAPSADYCIMRPATKEDWPENKWVQIGPYVSEFPWEAAASRLTEKEEPIGITPMVAPERMNYPVKGFKKIIVPKIIVPTEMLEVAMKSSLDAGLPIGPSTEIGIILESALRWLSENPIVPTDDQVAEMRNEFVPVHPHWKNIVSEWQRRMFLATEVPEEIEDLLVNGFVQSGKDSYNNAIFEAFRRGQKSKEGQ